MEPLSVFFILEGLTFDIIGAILVISGILNFKLKNTEPIKNLISNFLIPVLNEYYKVHPIKEGYQDINEVLKFTDKADFSSTLPRIDVPGIQIELQKQEQDHTMNKAYSGLPFLIGGFVLQGIGTVTQLN
jgi:hypothetical protein